MREQGGGAWVVDQEEGDRVVKDEGNAAALAGV